jgi:hypothetical protein
MQDGDIKLVDVNGCEFGYELIMVVPYVYYLYQSGQRVKVQTCKGMKDFYFFLSEGDYEEKYNQRVYSFPIGTKLTGIHFSRLDKTSWLSPNYREYYKDVSLKTTFNKPLVVISNKFSQEWNGDPINYININTLENLFTLLSKKYTVIYNRAISTSLIKDHQTSYQLGDYELIKEKYPEVIDMNRLYEYEGINYNRLQLVIGSKCDKFISVQGGTSLLSSLFGGTNLVYAVRGGEVENSSFKNWFGEFAGTTVESFSSYTNLIDKVKELWIS